MSDHFPICDLRFDLETSPAKIEAELTSFLRKLRWVAKGHDRADFDAVRDDDRWDDAMRACRPSLHDGDRIRRRASALADRRLSASGMAHLGRDARETLTGCAHRRIRSGIPTTSGQVFRISGHRETSPLSVLS